MTKVAIIGSNGQLGSDLCNILSQEHFEIIPITHDNLEISSYENCKDFFENKEIDVIINTAAYHNVPKCEEHIQKTFAINSHGALNIAKVSKLFNIKNVYVSSDYVFDGKKNAPYVEDDKTNPLNVYAASKVTGENFTQNYSGKWHIIRVSGLYGNHMCRAKGDNFVTKMIRLSKEKKELKIVNDEILTPTNTADISQQIAVLLNANKDEGIFHISNAGQCSWYEFACDIFRIMKIDIKVIPVSSTEFKSDIKRPSYSVMENKAMKDTGIYRMQSWRDALLRYLSEFVIERKN